MIKALTFALPNERGFERGGGKAGKIFERMETTVRKSSIYGKVMLAKNIDKYDRLFERNDSQCQNSFTMESLILAQDER